MLGTFVSDTNTKTRVWDSIRVHVHAMGWLWSKSFGWEILNWIAQKTYETRFLNFVFNPPLATMKRCKVSPPEETHAALGHLISLHRTTP